MSCVVYLAATPTTPGQGSRDAHALLNRLYPTVAHAPFPGLVLGPRGKPDFAAGPWHCSISHTRQLALCALALCPLGLDAEPQDRRVNSHLPRKVLSLEELAAWEASDTPDLCFLRLWTLKEAYGKYTGRGLEGYPTNWNFRVDYPQAYLEGSLLSFRLLCHLNHIIALCTPEPCSLQLVNCPVIL